MRVRQALYQLIPHPNPEDSSTAGFKSGVRISRRNLEHHVFRRVQGGSRKPEEVTKGYRANTKVKPLGKNSTKEIQRWTPSEKAAQTTHGSAHW